jgi:hypothetical protein
MNGDFHVKLEFHVYKKIQQNAVFKHFGIISLNNKMVRVIRLKQYGTLISSLLYIYVYHR